MAEPVRKPAPDRQPPGVAGEGLDPYPTYRDGPVPPHHATATKATDVGLPRSRRTYALPILLALAVFALVIVGRLLWQATETVDAGAPLAVENPATPATTSEPSETDKNAEAATDAAEPQGSLDQDVEAATDTGPGEVTPEPGAIDVPGGDTTTPANEPPAPQ